MDGVSFVDAAKKLRARRRPREGIDSQETPRVVGLVRCHSDPVDTPRVASTPASSEWWASRNRL